MKKEGAERDMNQKLARVALEEARQNYHGDTDAAIGNLQPLAELFESAEDVTLENLNADWSGAFAFLCAAKAGIRLPIRYPDPRVRASFAKVEAWEEYARLPKIGAWHSFAEHPEIGDLVVFEPAESRPAQMGIVLSVTEDAMDVAVGNHRNHSAVVERPLHENVRGFIRFDAE